MNPSERPKLQSWIIQYHHPPPLYPHSPYSSFLSSPLSRPTWRTLLCVPEDHDISEDCLYLNACLTLFLSPVVSRVTAIRGKRLDCVWAEKRLIRAQQLFQCGNRYRDNLQCSLKAVCLSSGHAAGQGLSKGRQGFQLDKVPQYTQAHILLEDITRVHWQKMGWIIDLKVHQYKLHQALVWLQTSQRAIGSWYRNRQ